MADRWHNAKVIELGSIRSLQGWANLDLRQLGIRHRTAVITAAVLCIGAAFAISYTVYRHFGAPRNEFDLRIYYSALTDWRSGADLYSYWKYDPVNGFLGFTYPPVAAILMSPMTTLPIRPVVIVASVAIFGSTVGLVLLSIRERLRLGRPQLAFATALAAAGACCLQPISQTAAYGQVNTLLALLVMFDIFVLSKRNSRWAGIGVGLAMAIKLTPAVFLLYLALSGRWRMFRVAILTAGAATLAAALCAPSASWEYFTSRLWDSSRIGVLDNTANQSINGTLARLSAPLPPDKLIWFLGVLVVVTIGSLRVRRAIVLGDALLAVSITGLVGVLVSPVSWIHHAVWVVPAMVVLMSRLVTSFPLDIFRRLAADPASVARLNVMDGRRLRGWVGPAVLTVTGLLTFVLNTRNVFGLPDTHYEGLGIFTILAGSVQTIWMLAAVLLLPSRQPRLVQRPARTSVEAARVQS